MGRELISIIATFYNLEKYASRCIESIIGQTYKELEILLLDDGSGDDTVRICRQFEAQDDRINVICRPHGGISELRNYGISTAHGEFFTFIDGDDYVAADHIENMYTALKEENCDIAVCDEVRVYDSEDGLIEKASTYRHSDSRVVLTAHDAVKSLMYQDWFDSANCGKLFRTSLFDGVLFPTDMVHEDTGTIYKAFLKSKRVVYTSMPSYYYYQRPESILHKKHQPRKYYTDAAAVIEAVKNDICAEMPDLHRAVDCRRYSMYAHIFINNYTVPENKDLADNAWRKMKQVRFTVMTDPHGRKKARKAALVSYFGKRLYYRLGTRHTNANSVKT